MDFTQYWNQFSVLFIKIAQSAVQIILILITSYIILKLRSSGIKKIFNITKWDEKKEQTLASLLMSISRYIVIIIAGLMILMELGFDITPILASAGVVGLAIGFGAQDLVKDFIRGFFIMFENQFHVGDFVQINGEITGTVEELGLRVTIIREWNGTVNYISNSSIQKVKNYNKEQMRVLVSFLIRYEEDYNKVVAVIDKLCKDFNETYKEHFIQDENGKIIEPAQFHGIDDIEENRLGAKYTIRALVKDTSYFLITRELRKAVLQSFRENGIRLAYPKRVYETNSEFDFIKNN